MSQCKCKVGIALKYCGSCNPYVELTKIAHHLADMAKKRGDFQLLPISGGDIDIVVILCGCARACGDKEEVRARAREILVVAGNNIGGRPVTDTSLLPIFEIEMIRVLGKSQVS